MSREELPHSTVSKLISNKHIEGEPSLKGTLGTASIVFMVLAAAAPLTVIGGNVPLAIGLGNGGGAPIGFLIAALVLLLFSVGFVTMTPYVRNAGAFFSYVTEGLGERLGMGVAAVALVTYTAIQVGIYGYLGWAVNDTVRFYGGPAVAWPIYSFIVLFCVAYLGYRNIHLSAKVLGVALILEVAVVVLIDLIILSTGGAEGVNVRSFDVAVMSSGSLGIAILFALTGFIGFESTAIFRDEARDPEIVIPRATYLAVIIIGGFYAVSTWALVLGAGIDNIKSVAEATLAGEANLLLDQTVESLGHIGRDVVNILLLTSLFACVLSFHNVIARYQYALARKGLLPARLGRVHSQHESPSVSSLVQTCTAFIIVGIFSMLQLEPLVEVFGSMAGVATMGMIILMLTTSIAVLAFFKRHSHRVHHSLWSTRYAPILAILGLIICFGLVVSNFTLVTGGSLNVSIILALTAPFAFFAGIIRGQKNIK